MLAVIGSGAGALSGCAATSADAGASALVIGDSITVMSRDRISEALADDGWSPTVEAVAGTDIAYWRHRAAAFARALRPEAVVIELGTNQRGDAQRVGSLVDAVMHGLRRVPTVLWMNVQEGKRLAGRSVPPDARAVNRALVDAQGRWANLQVLDFDGYFAGRAPWHEPDGVHPNPRGQAAIARFVADALEHRSGAGD